MSRFDDYANKYSMIRMRREDGILEMQFHTDGGPLRWSLIPHGQLEQAFLDVCLLYTSPSPRDGLLSRMPSSA